MALESSILMNEIDINSLVDEIVDLYFAGVSWRKAVVQIKLKNDLWPLK